MIHGGSACDTHNVTVQSLALSVIRIKSDAVLHILGNFATLSVTKSFYRIEPDRAYTLHFTLPAIAACHCFAFLKQVLNSNSNSNAT